MAQPNSTPEPRSSQDPVSLMMDRLTSLSVAKQISLLISVAAVVGLVLFLFTWSDREDRVPLPVETDPKSMQKAMEVLDQQGVDYVFEHNRLLVPKSEYYRLKLLLGAEGLVSDRETGGYALLDQDQGFGISHFKEQLQSKRALEGELQKAIENIQGVRRARVLIALPERTVFVRQQREATASVHLTLAPGVPFGDEQAESIAFLVANSVPRLSPKNVRIVDNRGRLLYDGSSDLGSVSLKKLKYQREIEKEKRERILSLLSPIVGGISRVRAEVAAEFDFTQHETTRETYEPDPMAVRSEQIIREVDGEKRPQGVPGALTNQPPRAGIAPETGYGGAGGEGGEARRRKEQTTRNYELDRTITHIKGAGVVLKRLQVSVVVDTQRERDPETGEWVKKPRSEAELEKLRQLVISAVGAQPERGDQVIILEQDFLHDVAAETEIPLWEQPWFIELVKQALVILAVLAIVFGVIRPIVRDLTRPDEVVNIEYPVELEEPPEDDEDEPETIEEIHDALNQIDVSLEQAAMEALEESDEGAELLEKVRSIVQNDPKMVAHILRGWLEEKDENNG